MAVHTYSRRAFLKAAGLAAGAVLLAPSSALGAGNYFTAYVEAPGKLYRGTRDGLVFESVDGGHSWQQVANFGKHCAIAALREKQKQIQADVVVQGYHFFLTSADARVWYTMG